MPLSSPPQIAEETAKKIEAASALYRPCSVRASVLYFVLNDLSGVDPMYQFSLDAYNNLFLISIKNSPKSDNLQVGDGGDSTYACNWVAPHTH